MAKTKDNKTCDDHKIFTSELTEIDTMEIYVRLSNYFKSDEFLNKIKDEKVFGEIHNEGFKKLCLANPESCKFFRYQRIENKKIKILSVEEKNKKFIVTFELLVNHACIENGNYRLEARFARMYDESKKSIEFKFFGIDAIV